MPYKLIKGNFHIHYPDIPRNGPEPDGDTLKFEPDQRNMVQDLPGPAGPDFNGRGYVNIRFEGIDTLETHYIDFHQHLDTALAERDAMLSKAGFDITKIVYFEDPSAEFKVKDMGGQPHPIRGHILANSIDPHGRIIAFVYPGDRPELDGSELFVNPADIAGSINSQLLRNGEAYPAFYTSLPTELKTALIGEVDVAQAAGAGVWKLQDDKLNVPFVIENIAALQALVIWPKLFRRLVRFFAAGNNNLLDFDAWLRSDSVNNDDSILLPTGELGNMHDIVRAEDSQTFVLLFDPKDLVIVPDGEAIGQPPRTHPDIHGDVRILAALVNPKGGQERGREVVTLMNVTPATIDINNWKIADRVNRQDSLNGVLAAGQVRQVTLDRAILSNQGGTITLFDDTGDQVDQISYSRQQAGAQGWTIVFY